jgi:D-serine deaminase-like pyridoxal phosphate-dependent protein
MSRIAENSIGCLIRSCRISNSPFQRVDNLTCWVLFRKKDEFVRLEDLDTPAVICDLDLLEQNLRQMADHCRDLDISFRAHTKAHKIPELAHWQLRSGASGIICQKIGEAEQMVAAGIHDILIPYNIVGQQKLNRLSRLARRSSVTVSLDSLPVAEGLSRKMARDGAQIGVLIEVDTGAARCGVQSPDEAVSLVQAVNQMPGLSWKGIMTYPSQPESKEPLQATVDALTQADLRPEIISGGGTGHEHISKAIGCNETRSGSYIWEGLSRIKSSEDLSPDRCPLRVLCTVVSVPVPGRVIVDGGMKTFASYPPIPYGECVEYPGVRFQKMSVEHGILDASYSSHEFEVGERISLIPLHQEMCLNLHDQLIGFRGDRVEVIWSVAGRGKVQ